SPCQVLSLVGEALSPGPASAVGLGCSSPEVPEIDALVDRTAVKTQVQVLDVTFLHRVHNFLRHPHSEGQVAAYLPHHYCCSNISGLDLHVLPGNLLHHAQSVLCAICAIYPTTPVKCHISALAQHGGGQVCRHKDDPFMALKNLPVNPRTMLQGVASGQDRAIYSAAN
uniref:Uncharacterized protein n=1 Tax=Sparus aurata TaxID=8175 RepID=A0A671WVP2_SPAAU